MSPEKSPMLRLLAEQYLANAHEVVAAIVGKTPSPPFVLKNGLVIHHKKEDMIKSLFYEIFHKQVYTRGGFYQPMPGDVIIDGGANIGAFSLFLCSLERNLRIFCFEPAAETRVRLEKNIAHNRLSENIQVQPHGLHGFEQNFELKFYGRNIDRSLYDRVNLGPHRSAEIVHCLGLEAALALCSIQQVDLLKLDIEGAEVSLLEGAATFDWTRIARVCLEFHNHIQPNAGSRSRELLSRYGFDKIEYKDAPTCGLIRASRSQPQGQEQALAQIQER